MARKANQARLRQIETGMTDAWKTVDLVVGWVRYADAKAAIMLTVTGVLATLLLNIGREHLPSHDDPGANWLAVGGAVLLVLSGLCSMQALRPRRRRTSQPNLLFFTDLAARSKERGAAIARREVQAVLLDREALMGALTSQAVSNSVVATAKFRWGNSALLFLAAAAAALFSLAFAV